MKYDEQIAFKGYLRAGRPRVTRSGLNGKVFTFPGKTIEIDGITYEQLEKGPVIGVGVALKNGKIGFSFLSDWQKACLMSDYSLEIIKLPNGKEKVLNVRKWTSKNLREFGTDIAVRRALDRMDPPSHVPSQAKHAVHEFNLRAVRYFKQDPGKT